MRGRALRLGIENPLGQPRVVPPRADALEAGGVHREFGRGRGELAGRVAFGAAMLEKKIAAKLVLSNECIVASGVTQQGGIDRLPERTFLRPEQAKFRKRIEAAEGNFERVVSFV